MVHIRTTTRMLVGARRMARRHAPACFRSLHRVSSSSAVSLMYDVAAHHHAVSLHAAVSAVCDSFGAAAVGWIMFTLARSLRRLKL